MLKGLGKLFGSSSNKPPASPTKDIPSDQLEQIELFSQNLEIIDSFERDTDKSALLRRIIPQFENTFCNIQPEHLADRTIRTSLEKFSLICGQYGSYLLDDIQISSNMFSAVTYISGLFSCLPNSKVYINLFLAIVQNSKKDQALLDASLGIITLLFSSLPFFFEFVEVDGFSLVFTSFFMDKNSDVQSFWIHLLFKIVPSDFYNMNPSATTMDIFVDTLKSQDNELTPYVSCIQYIVNYIGAFYPSNNTIIQDFEKDKGMTLLGNYIINHVPTKISDIYNELLITTNNSPDIFKAMYNVYTSDNATPEIKTSIILPISKIIQNKVIFNKFNKSTPLEMFIETPQSLNYEGFHILSTMISYSVDNQFIDSSKLLPKILELIHPPSSPIVPINDFLDLISRELAKGTITAADLVNNRFLEDFVLVLDPQQIAWFMSAHPTYCKLISTVYSSEDSQEFRFPVVQMFINASKYLSDMPSFVSFLSSLFTRHFSNQIVHLLLSNLENEDLVALLAGEISKRQEGPGFFFEANGLDICRMHIEEHPERANTILTLVASAASFGQQDQIDDFINSLDSSNPIFALNQKELEEAAYAFRRDSTIRIPSLLPYVKNFNFESPTNAYMAGKHAIKAFAKKNIKLEDIPGAVKIVNRYVSPDDAAEVMKHFELFDLKADTFSVFELFPGYKLAMITITHDNALKSVSFWYKVPTTKIPKLKIFSEGSMTLVSAGNTLQISTGRESMTVPAQMNEWHHILISFDGIRTKTHVDLYIDGNDPITLRTVDEAFPTQFILGDNTKPINSPIIFSASILTAERDTAMLAAKALFSKGPGKFSPGYGFFVPMIKNTELASRVGYLGICSYLKDDMNIERFFELVESLDTFGEFSVAFRALVATRIANNLPVIQFWQRMCLMGKRKADLIGESMHVLIDTIPYQESTRKRRTKALLTVLRDIELFNVLHPDSSVAILNFTIASMGAFFDIDYLEANALQYTMEAMMRSGVDSKVCIAACPIISKLLLINPNEKKVKMFLNTAVSSSEWSHGLPIALHDFPITSLLTLPMGESLTQPALLAVFVQCAKAIPSEVFTYQQLVDFMYVFDDARAVSFAEVICFYSQKNPKFVTNLPSADFSFARLATVPQIWSAALCIFGGLPYSKAMPSHIKVERPVFGKVIVEMLCSLSANAAHSAIYNKESEYDTLLVHIYTVLSTIPDDQFNCFLNPQTLTSLHCLSNMGIIPESILDPEDMERKEAKWMVFNQSTISKEELKYVQGLAGHSPFAAEIFESNEIQSASTNPMIYDKFLSFPFDLHDFAWVSNLSSVTSLASFIVSILFSATPEYFAELLEEFCSGNLLMYDGYTKIFEQELLMGVLSKLSVTEEPIGNYHKPSLLYLKKVISEGGFNDKYQHMLSVLFNVLKSIDMKGELNQFLSDEEILATYREILLASFIYVEQSKLFELFQLLATAKNVVFLPSVFSDSTFCFYWMHLTRSQEFDSSDLVLCMSLFVNVFDSDDMSEFNPEEVKIAWDEHASRLTQIKNRNYNKMDDIARQIASMRANQLQNATSTALTMSVFRTVNIYIQANISAGALNIGMRRIEKAFFFFDVLRRKLELEHNEPKSHHLSPIALPLKQPRAVHPSPFKVHAPPFGKVNVETMQLHHEPPHQRIRQLDTFGVNITCPQWCLFGHDNHTNYSSVFEYSKFIPQSNAALMAMFKGAFPEFADANIMQTNFYYYIHKNPAVLFYNDTKAAVLTLAQLTGDGMELIEIPQGPVAFMPFSESVALGEWNATMFCGHIVLTIDLPSILTIRRHTYIHKFVALTIFQMMSPTMILIFNNTSDCETIEKAFNKKKFKKLPNSPFLFTIQSPQQAMQMWLSGTISNYDYLLLLNAFGDRSFADLSQYPVFPWVISPTLEQRDLSLPMGQLAPARAAHYDQTFELSSPRYFYGFHYSLPGAVFWFMMRLPPFCYFGWDLNSGWDEAGRMFTSITDAYRSAAVANPSDLKELVPEMYTVPELLTNNSHINLPISDDVELPEWAQGSPAVFTDVFRKFLERTDGLNDWIDLIFGYKQTGEPALLAKNIFLPSSYHTTSVEDVDMDEVAFSDQVINFGQCPIQLFSKAHPPQTLKQRVNLTLIEKKSTFEVGEIKNPFALSEFVAGPFSTALPPIGASIPPLHQYIISVDPGTESLYISQMGDRRPIYSVFGSEYTFAKHIAVSSDGLFAVVTLEYGEAKVFHVAFENASPVFFTHVASKCFESSSFSSAIVSSDFIVATALEEKIVLWSMATGAIVASVPHQRPHTLWFDDFDGVLTVATEQKLTQYTLNGGKTRELFFNSQKSMSEPILPTMGNLKASRSRDLLYNDRCTSVGVLSYDFSFDGRIVVASFKSGWLKFFAVDSSDHQLCEIGGRKISKAPLESMFVDPVRSIITVFDGRKNSHTIKVKVFDDVPAPVCSVCGAPQTTRCTRCGAPLCDACIVNYANVCQKCAQELDFLSTMRF